MQEKGLGGLEIYKNAVKISSLAWEVYKNIPKQHQYHIRNQFLDSVDSIGANIAEGFGRYHFKDSLKFYYNGRGSLFESKNWLHLLKSRELANEVNCAELAGMLETEGVRINNFINSLRKSLSAGEL